MGKRKFGDRKDARKLRNDEISPIQAVVPYISSKRTENEVFINQKFDVTNVIKYINEKNKNRTLKVTYFHIFITAFAKTIHLRPWLNRYIIGSKLYQRHDVIISFVAKKEYTDAAGGIVIAFTAKASYTLDDIAEYITSTIKKSRSEKIDSIDNVLSLIQRLPSFMRVGLMNFAKILILYDLYPESVSKQDPNFSTILVTNLGSLNCDAIYHHLCNYGSKSAAIAIGNIHKEEVVMPDGSKVIRDIVNIGITVDERITDGFYLVKSIKILQMLLDKPEILERPLGEQIDIGN